MPLSEKELEERMALTRFAGPQEPERGDLNTAKIVQAIQASATGQAQDLDDAAIQWDAIAAEKRRKWKLRKKLKGKNR